LPRPLEPTPSALPDWLTGPLIGILVAAGYFAGAWLGVTQTISPEGKAIIWPPNAVALAALLLLPRHRWPWVIPAILLAEIAADLPAFPLWSAVAFGLINLFEVFLAATLIRWLSGPRFDFDSLYRGACFLLFGPLLAATLAAFLGAGVYLALGKEASAYFAYWQMWWFGDALGLLILTPLLVVAVRQFDELRTGWNRARAMEAIAVATLMIALGFLVHSVGSATRISQPLSQILLLPPVFWAAVRFGVPGAASAVALAATVSIGFMVHWESLPPGLAPETAILALQEFLAVAAIVGVGLSLMLGDLRASREELRAAHDELERKNRELEERVAERTQALREANRRLEAIASTDALTGIANRWHFLEVAQREVHRRRGADSDSGLALLMLDLDHFKQVNDTYGHPAGDHVLHTLALAIRDNIRPLDLCGRFGGEEFLILLPDADGETTRAVAERLRESVASTRFEYQGQLLEVTVSVGLAVWDGQEDVDELIQRADTALYRAKDRGRNRVEGDIPEASPGDQQASA
jgi:diguanylate cyclase (GGDEF)-like protein